MLATGAAPSYNISASELQQHSLKLPPGAAVTSRGSLIMAVLLLATGKGDPI
jgi:hypothetical protein